MAKTKKVEYESQGYGVYPPLLEIAKETLRQERKSLTKENINNMLQRLAAENAESYTPNPELGKNPESRVSKQIRNIIGAPIYRSKMSEKTRIEMSGAVSLLTQMILKNIYGFKTTRQPGIDTSNPAKLTDFEYIGTGPGNSYSKEQRDVYNKMVDVNRHIRVAVESYLFWAITPLLNETKDSFYSAFVDMGYKDMPASSVRSPQNTKEFAWVLTKRFADLFKDVHITAFLKTLRWKWRTKGGKKILTLLPSPKKKSGPKSTGIVG